MVEAYNGEEDYVFISYSHKDWCDIEPVLDKLAVFEQCHIWFDGGVTGGNTWNEFIANKLLHAKNMLLFLTENSADSKYVKGEIQFALNHEITIIPIYLKQFEIPIGLEIILTTIQAINIYDMDTASLKAKKIAEILPDEVKVKTKIPFYSCKNSLFYLESYSVDVPAKPPKHIECFKITSLNVQTNEKQTLFSYEPTVLHGDCNKYTVTKCETFKNDSFDECGNSIVMFAVNCTHYFLDFYPYNRGEDFVSLFTFCIIDPETNEAKVKLLDCKIATESHPYSLTQDIEDIKNDIKDDKVLDKIDEAMQK